MLRRRATVAAPFETAPRPPRRRRWRGILLLAGVALFAAGGVLALGYLPATSARSELQAGRRAMEDARAQLLAGEADAAAASFQEAAERFEAAADAARSPLLRPAGWVPLLRHTPHAVLALSEAGTRLAEAGVELTEAVAAMPGGLASLAPRDGAFPLDRFPPLAEAARRAEGLTAEAMAIVEDGKGSFLIGPVGGARREFLAEIAGLHGLLATGADLLDSLPGFLGAEGPRRYFLGAQNPAELRGTGGLMGAFSELTFDGGRLQLGPFAPVQTLPNLEPDDVPPPSPDYRRNYDQFGGAGFWLNMNMTPDFPSAARAIAATYELHTGTRLDGVILADPFALQALLEITGPVRVPGLGITVDADSVVAYTTNQAYRDFATSDERKEVLGDVARTVLARFLAAPTPSPEAIEILAETASEGHLLVWSADQAAQAALGSTSAGGALDAAAGDLLAVVVNNGAGNKLDVFAERTVTYDVVLEDAGRASASAGVAIENTEPHAEQPPYVDGPYEGVSAEGESVGIVNLYCAAGCTTTAGWQDGAPVSLGGGTELGYPFSQAYLRVPQGRTGRLRYDLDVVGAWEGTDSMGTYRLTVLTQTTVRPTHLRVSIVVPGGMRVVEASDGMRVDGGVAVWEGEPQRELVLEIRFEAGQPLRVLRDLRRFFGMPIRF